MLGLRRAVGRRGHGLAARRRFKSPALRDGYVGALNLAGDLPTIRSARDSA